EGEHGSEVELGPYLDAHAGEAVSGFRIAFARVQQRLRRDAADIETGAAMSSALLHHGDLHAELSRTNGGDIAARTCADDDEVVSHANADSTTARAGAFPRRARQPKVRVGKRAEILMRMRTRLMGITRLSAGARECRKSGFSVQ